MRYVCVSIIGIESYYIMDITNIIKQITNKNFWNKKYTTRVAVEYFRFMKLKAKYTDISPSDDIDIFWHQHILNTKSYYNFCTHYFKKIIHHYPDQANDQLKRRYRFLNSLKYYKKEFGNTPPDDIWKDIILLDIKKVRFDDRFCRLRRTDMTDPNILVKIVFSYYNNTSKNGNEIIAKYNNKIIKYPIEKINQLGGYITEMVYGKNTISYIAVKLYVDGKQCELTPTMHLPTNIIALVDDGYC